MTWRGFDIEPIIPRGARSVNKYKYIYKYSFDAHETLRHDRIAFELQEGNAGGAPLDHQHFRHNR